jgi:hypothetical protein
MQYVYHEGRGEVRQWWIGYESHDNGGRKGSKFNLLHTIRRSRLMDGRNTIITNSLFYK